MAEITNREKITAARNAYYREWRKKNKEKVKEYNDRYWLKKAQQEEARND